MSGKTLLEKKEKQAVLSLIKFNNYLHADQINKRSLD